LNNALKRYGEDVPTEVGYAGGWMAMYAARGAAPRGMI
jgi:hypothetical protein